MDRYENNLNLTNEDVSKAKQALELAMSEVKRLAACGGKTLDINKTIEVVMNFMLAEVSVRAKSLVLALLIAEYTAIKDIRNVTRADSQV